MTVERARSKIKDVVHLALEAGMTPEEITEEVEYILELHAEEKKDE
jgi:hypothetical protein